MRAARAAAIAAVVSLALAACGASGGETTGTTPGGFEVVSGEFAFAKQERCEPGTIGQVEDLVVGPGCYENYPWQQDGGIDPVVEDAQPVLGAGTVLDGGGERFTLTYRGGMWRLVDVEGWTYDPSVLYSGPEASLASAFIDLELAEGETITIDADGVQDLTPVAFHESAHYLGPDRAVLRSGLQGRSACGEMFTGLEEPVELTRDDLPDGTLTLALCFGQDHPPLESYPEPLLWILNSGTPDGVLRSAYFAINGQDPDAEVIADARASIEAIATAKGMAPDDLGIEAFDARWAEFVTGDTALASGDWRTEAAKEPYWALAGGVSEAPAAEGEPVEPPPPAAEPEVTAEGHGPFADDEEYEENVEDSDYDRGYDEGYSFGDEDWFEDSNQYQDPEFLYGFESDEFKEGYADGYADGNPDAGDPDDDEGGILGGGGDVFVDK